MKKRKLVKKQGRPEKFKVPATLKPYLVPNELINQMDVIYTDLTREFLNDKK